MFLKTPSVGISSGCPGPETTLPLLVRLSWGLSSCSEVTPLPQTPVQVSLGLRGAGRRGHWPGLEGGGAAATLWGGTAPRRWRWVTESWE